MVFGADETPFLFCKMVRGGGNYVPVTFSTTQQSTSLLLQSSLDKLLSSGLVTS